MTAARAAACGAALLAAAGASAEPQRLHFAVALDGRPIGSHVFEIDGPPAARTVRTQAAFRVALLGLTLYRYQHEATERWNGDCLVALQSRTEDDAPARTVRAEQRAGRLVVDAPDAPHTVDGCVMSFAYWHPALRMQTRLLNSQTGRLENVRVVAAGTGSVLAGGAPVPAQRWRIEGIPEPVEVWYGTADGRWLGLDATVAGGRRLSYRLSGEAN